MTSNKNQHRNHYKTSLTSRDTCKNLFQNPSVTKTYSVGSNHDAKLSHTNQNQYRSNHAEDSIPEMLENLAIWWANRILGQKIKNHNVKLLDMTESICCSYWSSPIYKNQHYNSIQSWYIAHSILTINFGMSIDWSKYMYLYMPNQL